MLKNYIKTALRHFGKHKLFTLINVAGLSVGVSAALVIYLIVHFSFSFDKFHPDGNRIYRVVSDFTFSGEVNNNGGVTAPLGEAVKTEVSGLQQSAHFMTWSSNVVTDNGSKAPATFKHQNDLIFADQRYFNLFKYQWLAGSAKTSLQKPNQVVLTLSQAQKYFPKLSASQMIGQKLFYRDDSVRAEVSGIVKDFSENTDLIFHDFISHSTINSIPNLKRRLENWGGTGSNSQLYLKLAPGATPQNVEAQLNKVLKAHKPLRPEDKGNTQTLRLQPLSDIHFNAKYAVYNTPTANITTLYGLMAIAAFLLLLGCINYINLTTAQSTQRAKEIGIRKTMGSTRRELIGQYLSETFLITMLAILIAMGIAPLILKLFTDFVPAGVSANVFHQPLILLFLLALAVVVSLLSGFYPALILSGYKPVSVLKNQAYSGTSKTRNSFLRKSLTVTQFVIAQFFIMATLLVGKQISFALHKDMGFKKDAIITIKLPYQEKNLMNKKMLLNQAKALPQVAMASLSDDVPSSNNWNSTDATYRDGKKEVKMTLEYKSGDENYIKLYHIRLLAGRNIAISDTSSGMLVNETYTKVLGFKTPQQALGKAIDYGFDEKGKKIYKQIVGVTADFYQHSLHQGIKPIAIFPDEKYGASTIHIALKPQTEGGDEWKQAISQLQHNWKALYPDEEFNYSFFDEAIAQFYQGEQHTSKLLTWATGLSVFISCLGLLGLAVYTANQRTKEIGVRKVLGATVAQIVAMLSSELVMLVALAFVLVSPAAWWAMHRWMHDFAVRTPVSWWIFALSGAGMLLTALATVSLNSVKAATANPVKSLRSE
ncbi:ABC transporter permease [Mucilaginibacter koreensis]